MEITDQIAVVAAAIALGSAMVSILAIYVPWRNTHDAEVFKESVLAACRTFPTFAGRMAHPCWSPTT
jgi:hypothetical protein